MGYCAVGSMSLADWNRVKALCNELQESIDERFRQLDMGSLRTIEDEIRRLIQEINAIKIEQATQNARLDVLEENAANDEITTSEILEMYNVNGGNP